MAQYVQDYMYYGTRMRLVADVVAEAMEAENSVVVDHYISFLMIHAFDTHDVQLRRKCDDIRRAHGWRPFAGPPASENNLPVAGTDQPLTVRCPACLSTPKAMELWRKAMQEEWVDENWQPLLSRPDAALLAGRIADVLDIDGWKPFEDFWGRKNMRQDYSKGMGKKEVTDFIDSLNRKLR